MTGKHWKLGALAVSCIAIGAGASAIASAGASTSAATPAAGHRALFGPRRLARRAVEGTLVVWRNGRFVTVTFARGEVRSVSGRELTIAEGTKKAVYRTVTLTIPTSATVRDERSSATLSDVKPGQRVIVIQAPDRTWVVARG